MQIEFLFRIFNKKFKKISLSTFATLSFVSIQIISYWSFTNPNKSFSCEYECR